MIMDTLQVFRLSKRLLTRYNPSAREETLEDWYWDKK